MTARQWRDWSCAVRVVVGHDADLTNPAVDAAESVVRNLMAEVAHAASRFHSGSDVERVNDSAPRLVPVSSLTVRLVEEALAAARSTGGAVDPTVGGDLLDLGYDADIEEVRCQIRRPRGGCRRRADWSLVRIDHDTGRIAVPRGLRLDLGATAKAWTVDEAARRVAARTGLPALVEIGGDLAVSGHTPSAWRVRVAEQEGHAGELIGLGHGGLATSSTMARRWRTGGDVAHHIVDPATGRPVTGDFRTATVWAPTALAANTASAAALVWGVEAPSRLATLGLPARLVGRDGAVRHLGDWPRVGRAA